MLDYGKKRDKLNKQFNIYDKSMKAYSKSLDEGVELSKKLTKVHASAAKKTKADKVVKSFNS